MASIKCFVCGKIRDSAAEARSCWKLHQSVATTADVERLIGESNPHFSRLWDGIYVARGAGDWSLVATCSRLAMAHAPQRLQERSLLSIARVHAAALLHATSYEDLQSALDKASDCMDILADTFGGPSGDAAQEISVELEELATALADGRPASLVFACSRLRGLQRADLGIEVAGHALRRRPLDEAALTTRAAASMDCDRLKRARIDLVAAENRGRHSLYVANAMSRLERLEDDLDEATRWAHEANQRDPEGLAGMPALAKCAAISGDEGLAAAAKDGLAQRDGHRPPPDWITYITAEELAVSSRLDRAEALLRRILSRRAYEPARRLLLYIQHKRLQGRPTAGPQLARSSSGAASISWISS